MSNLSIMFLFFLLIIASPNISMSASDISDNASTLKLKAFADKQEYEIGDYMYITIQFENNSNDDASIFLTWGVSAMTVNPSIKDEFGQEVNLNRALVSGGTEETYLLAVNQKFQFIITGKFVLDKDDNSTKLLLEYYRTQNFDNFTRVKGGIIGPNGETTPPLMDEGIFKVSITENLSYCIRFWCPEIHSSLLHDDPFISSIRNLWTDELISNEVCFKLLP